MEGGFLRCPNECNAGYFACIVCSAYKWGAGKIGCETCGEDGVVAVWHDDPVVVAVIDPPQPPAIDVTIEEQRAKAAEAERLRQEELARAEAERLRQEELARIEAERLRQEELARIEAERLRQEELARAAEAERLRQAELARAAEEERRRQEELARDAEEERRRNEGNA